MRKGNGVFHLCERRHCLLLFIRIKGELIMKTVPELFGRHIFDDKAMKVRLPRKAYKSLKRTKFDFDYLIPDYEVMVSEMAEWVKAHKDLYPHYKLK